VPQVLQQWQREPAFQRFREGEALGELAEAELQNWRALWVEVDTLVRQAQLKK
jgi:hypothetical protein